MKTIDTSRLWHVHAATEHAHPEIVGPGGIVMDVYDATTEQAQEIADILNGAAQQTYSVTARAGDCEITYSAPFADEVMWMYQQNEPSVEGPDGVDLSDMPGMIPSDTPAPETIRCGQVTFVVDEMPLRADGTNRVINPDMRVDEASTFYGFGRQGGKSRAMLQAAYARADALMKERDLASKELEHYRMLATERNFHLVNQGKKINTLENHLVRANSAAEKLQYERQAWEDTAAQFARHEDYYRGIVDRCARAIGSEAFTCDDGSYSESPLRAKVAELVEKMCAERAGDKGVPRSQVHELIAGAIYSFAAKLTTMDDFMVGRRHLAAPVAEAAEAFCKTAGLIGEPDVKGWNTKITLTDPSAFTSLASIQTGDTITGLPGGPRVAVVPPGPCAKQRVIATIITPAGMRFTGENDCANPQATCPRDAAGYKTGEGYHLCKEVCQQTDHAEINAIKAAGKAAKGSIMYIEGHTYACDLCRKAMVEAGIKGYKFGAPPHAKDRS